VAKAGVRPAGQHQNQLATWGVTNGRASSNPSDPNVCFYLIQEGAGVSNPVPARLGGVLQGQMLALLNLNRRRNCLILKQLR